MYLIQHYVIKVVSDLPHMTGVLDTALCYKVVSELPHDGVYLIQHYIIKLSVNCHMMGCT